MKTCQRGGRNVVVKRLVWKQSLFSLSPLFVFVCLCLSLYFSVCFRLSQSVWQNKLLQCKGWSREKQTFDSPLLGKGIRTQGLREHVQMKHLREVDLHGSALFTLLYHCDIFKANNQRMQRWSILRARTILLSVASYVKAIVKGLTIV